MRFDMHKPCFNCPFLCEGGIKLRPERIEEISDMMLSTQGGTFPCHKTTEPDEEDDLQATAKSRHCAGALIYAEKQGTATQMMRIMERIGGYDHTKLEGRDLVWEDVDHWLESTYWLSKDID